MHLTDDGRLARQVDDKKNISTASSDSGVVVEDCLELDNGHSNHMMIIENKSISTELGASHFLQHQTDVPQTDRIIENNYRSSPFTTGAPTIPVYNISHEGTPQQPRSPASSVRSQNISIVSLDDGDSSVIDSDSEIEEFTSRSDLIIQKLGQHPPLVDGGVVPGKDGVIVINNSETSAFSSSCSDGGCLDTTSKPQIGSIAVQNSTDITFGNKTYNNYQGPVTIKQFLLDNKKWKEQQANNAAGATNGASSSGNQNSAFENDQTIDSCRSIDKEFGSNSELTKGQKFGFNTKTIAIIGTVVLVFGMIGAITTMAISFHKAKPFLTKPGDGDDSRKHIPINSTIGDDILPQGNVLRFVSRDEWVAQPANDELTELELPVDKVIIAHTATEACQTQGSCVFRVKFIQTFHMESRGWDDIAYNFLVGGDGSAYEGRGWDKQGAHTRGYNVNSICIAFIGTFIKVEPSERQIKAAKLLIDEGIKLGKINPNYRLYGHRQLIPSESPGEALYKIIKTWPHWTDVPVVNNS